MGKVDVSEYQYYEFIAIDHPLTAAQQDELRAVSTRGRISSSSFVNDYQWGDLKADPRDWMERYFDAFLYLANWGTRRITLRLPIEALSPETIAAYCVGDSAHAWTTDTHVVIDVCSEDEDGEEWWEQEGVLASVVPARAELATGDHRLLYLAWLLCVQNGELDDDEVEPAVPPGLESLSGSLGAFADFLRLDGDLLVVAAEASAPLMRKAASKQALSRWVKAMPQADKDEVVLRLMRGDEVHLRSELLRRFSGPVDGASPGLRTAGALREEAEARRDGRGRDERDRATVERERREKAAAAARETRLNTLAGRQEEAWRQVDALIDAKRPNEYDAAVDLLNDLRTVAERKRDVPSFLQRVQSLRESHARKASLLERLDRNGLGR